MKFTKVIKAEGIYDKYKREMDTANSNYDVIGKELKALQDKLYEIKSKASNLYYMASSGDNKELTTQAKELSNLVDDAAWDGIHELQQAILKVIYK